MGKFGLIGTVLCGVALTATGAYAADIKISKSDGSCPSNYRLMEYAEISLSGKHDKKKGDLTVIGLEVCEKAGQWDILRLSGGGSFGGPGYKCHHFTKDTRTFGGSVCIKGDWNPKQDRAGGDLGILLNPRPTNVAQCEEACFKNSSCDSWTFETNPGGACHLKRGTPGLSANANLISGTTGR
ncbi:MAG: PAN domain-containing protein [Rhizobiales bacterium]|nr:PAN domain-containing protein [Hyphomicrobiales bacterium]